jgi:2'-5' RNA ligase/GNAT superfamily N-acetyltransferase
MMDIVFRKPETGDIADVRNILNQWTEPEEVEKYCQRINNEIESHTEFNMHFWVSENDGKVVGIGGLADPLPKVIEFCRGGKSVEIKILYLDSAARGLGLGKEFLVFLERQAAESDNDEIIIRSDNKYEKTAWGFYDKMGYMRVGTVDEDMAVFRKELCMKTFKITAYFELISKPLWLDEFRRRYDNPTLCHITFKYPTYIDDTKLNELRAKLQIVASKFRPIEVVFDSYKYDKIASGNIVLVIAKKEKQLVRLQKEIVSMCRILSRENVEIIMNNYEENFEPHITIGRKLSDEKFEEAKKLLQIPVECKAVIDSLTLTTNTNDAEYYKLL